MDKSLLKIVILISAFIGGLCGILTGIPFLGPIAFMVLLCFAAVLEIIFLTRAKVLELFTVQESATIGGIIGFVSFMVFCIVYFPLVIILANVFHYSSNEGISLFLGAANFWIILIFSVFMAILSATINAFMGFLTFYLIGFIKTLDENEQKRHNQFK